MKSHEEKYFLNNPKKKKVSCDQIKFSSAAAMALLWSIEWKTRFAEGKCLYFVTLALLSCSLTSQLDIEMEGPPSNDFCSVCHGNFNTPCQANCSHWFCGRCLSLSYYLVAEKGKFYKILLSYNCSISDSFLPYVHRNWDLNCWEI